MTRKVELPQTEAWNCSAFHDVRVQTVLLRRFEIPESITEAARQELLAWPIIAFDIVDEVAQENRNQILRHTNLLTAYVTDRQFVADLLAAVTSFHETKECDKPLLRRIVEICNQRTSSPEIEPDESRLLTDEEAATPYVQDTRPLLGWKSICDELARNNTDESIRGQLNCKGAAGNLNTEWSREKDRRLATLDKWQRHFNAWNVLLKQRRSARVPVLPLEEVILT